MIELRGISKKFGAVYALRDVSLKAQAGQVLAIVGENGAGKSTLMNILSGTYAADSFDGELFFEEKKVSFASPREAQSCGVAIIHQELSTFEHLTVAENMAVGHWPTRRGFVDWRALNLHAQAWLDVVGAKFSPDSLMGELSVGSQQLVEIAKALSRHSKVLILDEPTSSLNKSEADHLFKAIRQLCQSGRTILYISHKLEEIFALAQQVVVLRDGQVVHSSPVSEVNEKILIEKMVGRSTASLTLLKPASIKSKTLLSVKNLQVSFVNRKNIGPISFDLQAGEIIGLAGILGAGRSETMQALMGEFSSATKGEVSIEGQPLALTGPIDSLRQGLVFVGEDRKRDSLLPTRNLLENISISRLAVSATRSQRLLDVKAEKSLAQKMLEKMKTRFHSQDQLITELSGGNQQKVILGRALQVDPKVLLLDEPTRGVDVGARFEIYKLLFDLAEEGHGLIVSSSDLLELIELCDRILVIHQGQVAGELIGSQISQAAIMQLAVQGASS